MRNITFRIITLVSAIFFLSACSTKEEETAEAFITQYNRAGNVKVVWTSEVDSTRLLPVETMLALQQNLAERTNLSNPSFAKPTQKQRYWYIQMIYTVTQDDGRRDSFFHTIYMDKAAEKVYGIKNNK